MDTFNEGFKPIERIEKVPGNVDQGKPAVERKNEPRPLSPFEKKIREINERQKNERNPQHKKSVDELAEEGYRKFVEEGL